MRLRTLNDIMIPLSPDTLEAWEQEKQKILENLRFSSSIDLLHTDTPLNAQIFDAVEYDSFVVEKVIFQSLPGFYVTGNLYRPKDMTKKYPVILNPHGHWKNGRFETQELGRLPQRCANFAMRGIVAFIYDMIGYNDSTQVSHDATNSSLSAFEKPEIPEAVYKSYLHEYEKWNVGRFSLQLNNSMRAVDFVSSLPYVDTTRIGCTGCSGGATQTYFLSALDERIRVVAPINMASTIMQGGCLCENTAFLRIKYNNVDYTMTIAPRPLFLSGSDGDWTVHSREVEFPAVEKIYKLYNASDMFSCFYQSAPHCYNLPTRERVYAFFCHHFGIPDPFGHEVDLEIDTDALRIGDITRYVPCTDFIDSEEKLFIVVRSILQKNLAKLPEEQRNTLNRQIFALDTCDFLDIPYIVKCASAPDKTPEICLGNCPATEDDCGVKYVHTYNRAEDAKRVNALYNLMHENPETTFVARGKTASLCRIASALAGHASDKLQLSEFQDDLLNIPGLALVSYSPVS